MPISATDKRTKL